MKSEIKYYLLFSWLFVLIAAEIGRVYFIMPFPGSQQQDSLRFAYFLHNAINYIRVFGVLGITYLAANSFKNGSRLMRVGVVILIAIWLLVAGLITYKMQADKMFYEPKNKVMAPVADNKVLPQQLVIGVTLNGQSRAYPIELIGYHHQVRDSVGGIPVMVTYCTVCRAGRVFNPLVNGEAESFRLVGMDHFNAMFEDSRTRSWWRQVNGKAVAGPLTGMQLEEIPSEQMTLAAWISWHPNTLILQPDNEFSKSYLQLANYDEGKTKSRLTRTDSVSWQDKSLVVGVTLRNHARAYDWITLNKKRLINDRFNDVLVVVAVEPDSASFHVWMRPDSLRFAVQNGVLTDEQTASKWNWNGTCTEGKLKGSQLTPLQAYQEFWHSWRTFNPLTTRYLQGQ